MLFDEYYNVRSSNGNVHFKCEATSHFEIPDLKEYNWINFYIILIPSGDRAPDIAIDFNVDVDDMGTLLNELSVYI